MVLPMVPNIPIQKSPAALALYEDTGPEFGRILYNLYNSICAGDCNNIERDFVSACIGSFAGDLIFPFINQTNHLGEIFGHAVCISVNDEIAHGRPQAQAIKPGDVISVDCGLGIPFGKYHLHLDAAFTAVVQDNYDWTVAPLLALQNIVSKNPTNTSQIAKIIHETAKTEHMNQIVRLTGHGIGLLLHEAPIIHNAPGEFRSVDLFDGLCFCAEPIFVDPSYDKGSSFITQTYLGSDGWVVSTTNGAPTSHFETTFGIISGQVIDLIGVTNWFSNVY